MSAKVYFSEFKAQSNKDGLLPKTARLFEALYKDKQFFTQNNLVGIKAHFGEMGLTTFLSPVFARTIVEKVKEKQGNPFLFDTSTLYTNGKRTNAADHLNTAAKNGFSFATLGAPILIADGLTGANHIEIETGGQSIRTAKLAKDIKNMDAVICLTHFKGHCVTGFGGSLKNISMGMADRSGKLEMHSATKPFTTSKCTACGICVNVCPVSAIKIRDKKAQIDNSICIGCMHCDAKCPANAIKFNWDAPADIMMSRMVEYAKAYLKLKGENTVYFNFLVNITPDCDCYGFSNPSPITDIGVLASSDPLAIDQASIDIINKKAGHDFIRKIWPHINYEYMLEYAEEMQIGTRKYSITNI